MVSFGREQSTMMPKMDEFPLSSKYDPEWILENQMGLNALWLTEWLCRDMDLKPNMRVLDLGCGKAMSSIFLTKEYGVEVWPTDLWIGATDNWERIREAGVEDRVFPIHADARSLPYAEEFFDAIVCVDAYIYYGTDDLYLNYLVQFVPPDGQIGIVVPGLMQDFDGPLPKHLTPFWGQDCWSWHTIDWWQHLWERTGLVDVELAETMPDGCRIYLQWKRALEAAGNPCSSDIEVLEADGGRYIGFMRMVARRKEEQ